jgi:hypothetical protein
MSEESGKRALAGWNDFFEAVADMRLVQKEYFKTKGSAAMFRAKDLELLVDRTIAEHRERLKGRGNEVKWWIYRLAIAIAEAGQWRRFPAFIALGLRLKDIALE